MSNDSRPDLSNTTLYVLLGALAVVLPLTLFMFAQQKPGSTVGQLAATLGAGAFLAPMTFSFLKRSGFKANSPFWFVIHALCACLGTWLIFVHAAGGQWLSVPGVVLFLMLFLILQGIFLRAFVSKSLSYLFARNSAARGFGKPGALDKTALSDLIEQKVVLLKTLDSSASEALFSPTLKHWVFHPVLSARYRLLAMKEVDMVGAREAAGPALNWSRRIHMTAALMFYAGLFAHVFVVLFFAGYVAGDGEIYWWYITDWG